MEQTAENVIVAIFDSILFEENLMFHTDIKKVLDSKKVTDHHAIIPTMEIAKSHLAVLPETERKILSLIANRLLCATGGKHLYETVKTEFTCAGHTFTASGKSVLNTEDSLLSAMERAGGENMGDVGSARTGVVTETVERKGFGTPTTKSVTSRKRCLHRSRRYLADVRTVGQMW